ncbi:MAG: helix-turn-helix transcriptional regulator [Thermoplasmata archaeon]|nr:helix-turn-helix transcriptional regulator [Thermoplasmata archaeon]
MRNEHPISDGSIGVDGPLYVDRYCKHVEQKLKGGLSSVLVLYTIGGAGRPIHGYSIIQRIDELTGGYVKVRAGTVYPILRNLEEMGLVSHDAERSVRGPERKVYTLTDDGKEAVGRFDQVIGEFYLAIASVRSEPGKSWGGPEGPDV